MASLGAKVLQARSVEFAKKYGVPVHVRSTFKADPGTLVTREENGMEAAVVTGVTHDRSQAKISILRVPDRPGIAARVFGAVAERSIVVDMIVQNISRDSYTDISFTLPRGDHARAASALDEIAREVGAEGILYEERVAKVSIIGVGMRSHSGVAARMFAALSREAINIQMISTSEIAVSCVIEDKYAELAVRALHDAFELGGSGSEPWGSHVDASCARARSVAKIQLGRIGSSHSSRRGGAVAASRHGLLLAASAPRDSRPRRRLRRRAGRRSLAPRPSRVGGEPRAFDREEAPEAPARDDDRPAVAASAPAEAPP